MTTATPVRSSRENRRHHENVVTPSVVTCHRRCRRRCALMMTTMMMISSFGTRTLAFSVTMNRHRTVVGSSSSSGGTATTASTTTALRDYAYIDWSDGDADDDDDFVAHHYHPRVVVEPHPDSRIVEWDPPPPPSYMPQREDRRHHPHHDDDDDVDRGYHPADDLWSRYMTVSEESVADPDELRTRLAPTAPRQPHTPSPEEFLFAEIKDLVFNDYGGGNTYGDDPWRRRQRDLARPGHFDEYMTVSEAYNAPPPPFVDAEIVVAEEEEENAPPAVLEVVERQQQRDGGIHPVESESSSRPMEVHPDAAAVPYDDMASPPPPPPHFPYDEPFHGTASSCDEPFHDTACDDPLTAFEQTFPESPVTMKQLAEEYRRREEQREQQQQQQYRHAPPQRGPNGRPPPGAFFDEGPWFQRPHGHSTHPDADPSSSSSFPHHHQPPCYPSQWGQQHHQHPSDDYRHVPLPDRLDLAREWISRHGTRRHDAVAPPPSPEESHYHHQAGNPSMEDLAEAWVRMTATHHGME